jgi:phosphonate ABC transporter permease subunit PhnE
MPPRKMPPLLRSLLIALGIVAAFVIYAFGVEVTQVNLTETQKPERLVQLTRIIRAIAQPSLYQYDQKELTVRTPFMLPCPDGGYEPPAPDKSGPYLTVTPACAGEREEVTVEGFNFQPTIQGPLDFIPPSEVRLQMGTVTTDSAGHFKATVTLPKRSEPGVVQNVEVTLRANVGAPHVTQAAKDTWDKIVETVFLALLATTIGIFIAIPVSFIAASNLMRPITSPLGTLALTLLALPVGSALGAAAVKGLGNVGLSLGHSPIMGLGALMVSPLVVWGAARWALPQEDAEPPAPLMRLVRGAVLLAVVALVAVVLGLLSILGQTFGNYIASLLGSFGFIGFFIFTVAQALGLLLPVIGAMIGAFVLVSLAGSLGEFLRRRLGRALKKIVAIPLAGATGAVYFGLVGSGLAWLYQLSNPVSYLWIPAGIGAALGLGGAALADPEQPVPIGTVIYYLTRTILNALRSIEPLIMVIVVVVWVGIGPFAGTLALAVHTIAALGKLYSEQVESILHGPLEAVQATGADRLQTVIYAVIPQVVPPYISFTMYRWDINVRMSTIIGFAGGGGIGFLLLQNINLLQYRAAAVQMLAIAIVVASMDYLSAVLREKAI